VAGRANSDHTSETIEVASASAQNAPSKQELRATLLAARATRPADDLATARAAIATAAIARAGSLPCVGAYVPLRTEPGSVELLSGLAARGVTVLVPVLLADRDLAWRRWPDGPAAPIEDAALLFVPALAVDRAGFRLGRGGGSYDRVLARLGADVATVALVFDDEVLASVPVDPWDRPVDAALTPGGSITFAE
jgi:5-formyltetrahydrofolate cyclo-ligase